MASEAKGCDPVVVGLDGPALPVPQLVAVGSHHGAILNPAGHAGSVPDGPQQLVVSVHQKQLVVQLPK